MPVNKGYLMAKTNCESDEVFTPAYAIIPLIEYLNEYRDKIGRNPIIWCPFDNHTWYTSITI